MSPLITAVERILLTLWVGGMCAIGYLAAPVLFAVLDDRSLAGTLAGRMFEIMNYVGLVLGGLLLLSNRVVHAQVGLDRRAAVLVLMLSIILLNHFGLAPAIAELRTTGLVPGSDDAALFGRLHGLASILYLTNTLMGLGLVVAGIHHPDRR